MPEGMLNGMSWKVLLFVFAIFASLRPMMMPMVVMTIGRQVIRNGPIGLKFPTA